MSALSDGVENIDGARANHTSVHAIWKDRSAKASTAEGFMYPRAGSPDK